MNGRAQRPFRVPASLLVLLGGCTASGPTFVPLPAELAGGSIVLALPEEGRFRYVAFDLEDFSKQELPLSETEVVEAYVYAGRLEENRIPSGPLLPVSDGSRLPGPTARLNLIPNDESTLVWAPASSTPTLDALEVELISPCRRFELETISLDAGQTMFLAAADDQRVILGRIQLGGNVTSFHSIGVDGRVEDLADFQNPTIFGAAIADDQLWLTGTSGRVLVAPLSDITKTSTLPPAPSAEVLRRVVTRKQGGRVIITTLTGGGTLERLEDGVWTTLRAESPVETDDVALLQLEDGETLSATPKRRAVTSERAGTLSDESLTAPGAPLSLALLRGRPVAGMARGEILERSAAARWSTLAFLPLAVEVYSFLEFPGGYLVGGGDSTLVEWNDELGGFCDPVPLPGGGGVYHLARAGDVIFAAGRPVTSTRPLEVRLLRIIDR